MLELFEYCYRSLIDVDLSWTQLSLGSVNKVFNFFIRKGYEDAEIYHNGKI